MGSNKIEEWRHWLNWFVAIYVVDVYVKGVTIKTYKSRFNSSNLPHQLKVIYSAYSTIVCEEPDYYTKCNIIDFIIHKRYEELKETSSFLDEESYGDPNIAIENIKTYKHNVDILTYEIELLVKEYNKLKKKHDSGL